MVLIQPKGSSIRFLIRMLTWWPACRVVRPVDRGALAGVVLCDVRVKPEPADVGDEPLVS
jgi:hypothetical protein